MTDAADPSLALTAQIISAYVSKNPVPPHTLLDLISQVRAVLGKITAPSAAARPLPEPAVPIRKSVFTDYIVCLEDGKKLKMMKRHLMSSFGMTPEAYRERWGLPSDYPMTAPSYAMKRSTLAKGIGLGRKSDRQPEAARERREKNGAA